MEHRPGAWMLWPRALVVGLMTFALGVGGHVTGGGRLPSTAALVLLLALCVCVSAPLLAVRATSLRLVMLLAGGQAVVHLLLSVSAGHRGADTAATSQAAHPVAAHLPLVDGRRVGSLGDAYAASSPEMAAGDGGLTLPLGSSVDALLAHAPMMLAHMGAAAALGLFLAYGESALWTLIALLGSRLLRLPVTNIAVPARRAPIVQTRPTVLSAGRLRLAQDPLRGPPVSFA